MGKATLPYELFTESGYYIPVTDEDGRYGFLKVEEHEIDSGEPYLTLSLEDGSDVRSFNWSE